MSSQSGISLFGVLNHPDIGPLLATGELPDELVPVISRKVYEQYVKHCHGLPGWASVSTRARTQRRLVNNRTLARETRARQRKQHQEITTKVEQLTAANQLLHAQNHALHAELEQLRMMIAFLDPPPFTPLV